MSAGAFIDSVYTSDAGLTFPIRVQPETELAELNGTVNDAPGDEVTPGAPFISVRVPKRSPRLQVRYVIVKMLANPTGQYADYAGIGTSHRLVVSDPAVFSGLSKGQPATYLGTSCRITRVVGEVA
jgi:hypothetical protein